VESQTGSDEVMMSEDARDTVATEGAFERLLRRVVDVRPGETRAMMTSFVFFFFLLSSYFVLRPIRDEVAASSGVTKLPWLFAGTLTVTLIFNPFFSALVVRFPVRKVIPISYQFFVANLLVFYGVLRFMSRAEGSTVDIWTGRAFFVWITVFALFNTSIFWCLMADSFRSEQAKRMFGFIGVGGTFGSIVGSAVTASLAPRIGTLNLLLMSVGLLELAVFTVVRFPLQPASGAGDAVPLTRGSIRGARGAVGNQDVIGGSVWAGFTHVVRSPYLFGICVFMVLFTIGSTFLYFEQSDIVGHLYASKAARTAVLARLELAAQVLTVMTQIFFTGRIIRWLGLAATLALLPALSIVGFGALGAMPGITALAVLTVLRRAGNFALTNPAMEVLFTVVKREDKYKAKNIIETFVYRGGDQIGAWTYAGLIAIGFGLTAISYAAIPLSLLWLALGLWLGRKQAILAGDRDAMPPVVGGILVPSSSTSNVS
jgi:ATP:ADP antiporter, AAA family